MKEIPITEVTCRVANCKFYRDNYCFAPNLEINNKTGTIAKTSNDVQCASFRLQ
ncbi:MAG: DUF1540 domain-containing protein [Alkaliphilus sp.]